MSSTVLVTGCTGFVGSALVANLLASGHRVIAVARRDPDGDRTLAAVQSAAAGFGLSLQQACEQRLLILDVDPDEIEAGLPPQALADVSAVWHTAAEMSYASQKLLASYQANVANTVRLYRHAAAHAPQLQRFFYVSTAYVAGMRGGVVSETLHVGEPYVNTYQITKWGAEQALAHAQQHSHVPVTLFRPTIIVGHRSTGWARRNGFGFHMFIEAIASVGRAGLKNLRLHLKGPVRPDLVTIDTVVHDALQLTRTSAREGLEIYHCGGGCGVSIADVMTSIGNACGVAISFGPPESGADKRIDRAIDINKRFANTEWVFERKCLNAALGATESSPPVSVADLQRMVNWYLGLGEVGAQDRLGLRERGQRPAVDALAIDNELATATPL